LRRTHPARSVDESKVMSTVMARPFGTRAEIYWKTKGDNLVWTKGFVMFVGL
jgi:hypothetical protein